MWDTITCLKCCDCGSALPVSFAILTSDYRIALLTACPTCADGVTVRVFKVIERPVFIEANLRGLPVVKYGRTS